MYRCFFVSDIHGRIDRYNRLFDEILEEKPNILFIGGDILPAYRSIDSRYDDFIQNFLVSNLLRLKEKLISDYPEVFLILGNDDPMIQEEKIIKAEETGFFLTPEQIITSFTPFFRAS